MYVQQRRSSHLKNFDGTVKKKFDAKSTSWCFMLARSTFKINSYDYGAYNAMQIKKRELYIVNFYSKFYLIFMLVFVSFYSNGIVKENAAAVGWFSFHLEILFYNKLADVEHATHYIYRFWDKIYSQESRKLLNFQKGTHPRNCVKQSRLICTFSLNFKANIICMECFHEVFFAYI